MREEVIYAVIDIGTNTVLMLALTESATQTVGIDSEVSAPPALLPVHEYCTTTRLGEGLGATGRLGDKPVARTLAAVKSFVDRTKAWSDGGCGVAVATSAVRDAANAADFLQRCQSYLDSPPHLLSGAEEARTIFAGASSDRRMDEPLVCIDIGGGSTEVSAGTRRACAFSASLDIGCVRFGEKYSLYETPSPRNISAAKDAVESFIEPVCSTMKSTLFSLAPGKPTIIVSGGTATTFAAIDAGIESYDAGCVHGYESTNERVRQLRDRMWQMSVSERAACPGMPEGRAPVFPGGLFILSLLLDFLNADRFTVTTRGLRFGAGLRLQQRDLEPCWSW